MQQPGAKAERGECGGEQEAASSSHHGLARAGREGGRQGGSVARRPAKRPEEYIRLPGPVPEFTLRKKTAPPISPPFPRSPSEVPPRKVPKGPPPRPGCRCRGWRRGPTRGGALLGKVAPVRDTSAIAK